MNVHVPAQWRSGVFLSSLCGVMVLALRFDECTMGYDSFPEEERTMFCSSPQHVAHSQAEQLEYVCTKKLRQNPA
jgi:hypothetical protein